MLTLRTTCAILLACFVGCSGETGLKLPNSLPEFTHPLFATPVSASNSIKPAIQVDILDASEAWFFTAELYLAVQSSRFPDDTWVVLPLNRGGFDGVTKRFIDLPFEVREGDTVAFNLLDNDGLTFAQEMLIVGGCQATGYCIFRAGCAYQPALTIARPVVGVAADGMATLIIDDCKMHQFDNYGVAEFIVPSSLPGTPNQANKLTILDDSRYARVQLKLYGSSDTDG